MERPILYETGLKELLRGHDISAVVEYLSSKDFLIDQERLHIKTLKTKQEVVSYLYNILRVDSSRFDTFLDEIDVFTREYLSITLNHILELKKQNLMRIRARVAAKTEGTREYLRLDSSFVSPHPVVKSTLHDRKQPTQSLLTDSHSGTFDHINLAGSQDTGYQSSNFPSAFSVQSDIQESLPSKSQRDLCDQMERKPAQAAEPKRPLTNSASVVTITNNNYYLGPKPFQSVQPWPLSFPPQPIKVTHRAQSPHLKKSCDYQRKTQWFEDLLKKYSSELTRCLNVNSLLPHLQHEELLTSEEREFLMSIQKTSNEKKRFLLSILSSKGETAYERFISCLSKDIEHTGHADLVKLLTKECQLPNRVSDV